MNEELIQSNEQEGTTPGIDKDSKMILELGDSSKITNREREMYRTLRTNLEFSGVENKAVVITSVLAHDGKSTISYNLCVALAEAGKKVVYIDTDIRKSIFEERHKINKGLIGLAQYLSGQQGLKITDVIYGSTVKNLFVIPTGGEPSNPTELLGKKRMDTGLKELREIFDYVIIDTAPVGLVIDAAVIARFADASMLVLASNESRKGDAKNAIAQMKSANPNFLGVVLNKVRGNGGHYGNYYGRSYNSYY